MFSFNIQLLLDLTEVIYRVRFLVTQTKLFPLTPIGMVSKLELIFIINLLRDKEISTMKIKIILGRDFFFVS